MINSVSGLLFYLFAIILFIFYCQIIKMALKVMHTRQQEILETIDLINNNINKEEKLENESLIKAKNSLKHTKGLFIIVGLLLLLILFTVK